MFFIYYLYIKNTNSKIKYENIENLTSNKLNVINKNIICISNNEDFNVINYNKNISLKNENLKKRHIWLIIKNQMIQLKKLL